MVYNMGPGEDSFLSSVSFPRPVVGYILLLFSIFLFQFTCGREFFSLRLRLQSSTVTDFFLYGCGGLRYSTKINFSTVVKKFITVCLMISVRKLC